MSDNPFQAPITDTKPASTTAEKGVVDFRPIMWRWERLRLIYNGIVGAVTGLTAIATPSAFLFTLEALLSLFVCGAFANLMFCLGPAADAYLKTLGFDHPSAGLAIFAAGTLLTSVLAVATVAGI